MATKTLTDPDGDGILTFVQTVEDVDGDSLDVTLELDQINGVSQSGDDRNPSWLSYSVVSSIEPDGTRKANLAAEIQKDQLGNPGTTYTFKSSADDGTNVGTCTFTFDVKSATIDGSEYYYVDDSGNIRRVTLNTNWDLSTKDTESSFSLPSHPGNGVTTFGDMVNGEWLTLEEFVDTSNIHFHVWQFTTPYDPSTAVYKGSFNFGSELSGFVNGVAYKFDGSKIYMSLNFSTDIVEFDLSTPFDLTQGVTKVNTATITGTTQNWNSGMGIRADGKKLYIHETDYIAELGFGTPWDSTSLSLNDEFNASDIAATHVDFKRDGTRYFFIDDSGTPKQYDFGSPWDITTLQNVATGTRDATPTVGPIFGKK